MYEPLPASIVDGALAWAHGGGNAPNPEADVRWEMTRRCFGWSWPAPTTESIEQAYRLFEQSRAATVDDPKSRRHVEVARMALRHNMLEHLPAEDGRLKQELDELLALAEQLELPTLARSCCTCRFSISHS